MKRFLVAVGLAILLGQIVHAQVHGDLKAKTVVTDAATAAPGNLFCLPENTITSFTPSCANSGASGSLCMIDTNNASGMKAWTWCDGTSSFFVFPNTGSDVIANNEVLVGTGAGTAQFALVASVAGTIAEPDGSPSVTAASTLKFPNGTITAETSVIARIEPFAQQLPPISGNWYDSSTLNVTGGSIQDGIAAAANTLYYVPFYNPFQMTIKDIGLVSGAANLLGGNVKMCIYAMDPATAKPSTVVLNKAGSPIVMTAAASTVFSVAVHGGGFTPTVALSPGFYFLAFIADANVGLLRYGGASNNAAIAPMGWPDLIRGTARNTMWNDSSGLTYAGIGATCPTAGTVTTGGQAWRLGVQAN